MTEAPANHLLLANPLTEADRQFIYEQRDSYHFRVFAKAITNMYAHEAAQLIAATPEELVKRQGILLGLKKAINLIHFGVAPDLAKKPDTP